MIDLIDRSRKLHILIGQSGDTNGSPLFYLADISLIDIGHHPDIVETGNGKHLLPLIRTDLHIPVYILIDDKAGDRRFHHIGRWVCYVINGIHFLDTFGLGLGIGLLLLGLQEVPVGSHTAPGHILGSLQVTVSDSQLMLGLLSLLVDISDLAAPDHR